MFFLDSYHKELVREGRIKPQPAVEGHGASKAQELLLRGWAQKCTLLSDTSCSCRVPSESKGREVKYDVDVARATCTCPAASQKGMYKHLHVAANVAQLKGQSVVECCLQMAENLYPSGSYMKDGSDVIVLDNDVVSTVTTDTCSCVAASHHIHCICLPAANVDACLVAVEPAISESISESLWHVSNLKHHVQTQ